VQFPIAIGLRRSRFLAVVLLLGHCLGLLGVCLPPWPFEAVVILSFAIVLLALVAWWRFRQREFELRLFADGRVEWRYCGESVFQPARIPRGVFVHPWLSVFALDTGGRVSWHPVFPDSASPDDFRRLRLWLRWRQCDAARTSGAL